MRTRAPEWVSCTRMPHAYDLLLLSPPLSLSPPPFSSEHPLSTKPSIHNSTPPSTSGSDGALNMHSLGSLESSVGSDAPGGSSASGGARGVGGRNTRSTGSLGGSPSEGAGAYAQHDAEADRLRAAWGGGGGGPAGRRAVQRDESLSPPTASSASFQGLRSMGSLDPSPEPSSQSPSMSGTRTAPPLQFDHVARISRAFLAYFSALYRPTHAVR